MKPAAYGNDVCPSLATLIRIVITLATYNTWCEGTLSTLTPIQTFLLNTVSQDRLNSLVLILVEPELLDKIDANKVTARQYKEMEMGIKNRSKLYMYWL